MANTPIVAPAAPAASTAPTTTPNTSPVESTESEDNASDDLEAVGANDVSTTETAPKATSTQSAVKKALKQLKLKVDGKEYTEDLPFEIPDDPKAIEYMQRQLQLGKMGQSRAQQFTELQKQVGSFLERLQKDPKGALSDPNIGVDVKQLARQVIEEEIANSQKSPEQLEKEKLEAEIKELKANQKREKEEADKREFDRLQETAYEQYDMQITKALEGSELPKSPYVIKKMAEYMLLGLQNGMDVTPEDILPLVRDEIQGDIKDMFSALPDEVVEKMVGKDKLNSLRKKKVAKATTPPTPLAKSIKDVAAKPGTKEEPQKPQRYRDFFKI